MIWEEAAEHCGNYLILSSVAEHYGNSAGDMGRSSRACGNRAHHFRSSGKAPWELRSRHVRIVKNFVADLSRRVMIGEHCGKSVT